MAKALQRRRGTTEEHKSFTGLEGELTIDTDKHSIRVHDGVTAGGHEVLPKAKNDELYAPKNLDVGVTSVNGQTGDVTVDVGVTSINGNVGDITPEQTGCLPLSGGTMTGDIKFSGSRNIIGTADTGSTQIYGGTAWNKGSMLGVYGNTHTSRPGWLYFSSHDGTNGKVLIGKPDGTFTWDGKNVVRSVNGTAADASGNVTISVSGGGTSAYKIPYATCSTASKTGAKVATITNSVSLSLVAGAMVIVKFTNAPSTFTTLNVNSTGAKTAKVSALSLNVGNSNCSMSISHANGVYVFVYDGSNWNFVTPYGSYSYTYEDSGD